MQVHNIQVSLRRIQPANDLLGVTLLAVILAGLTLLPLPLLSFPAGLGLLVLLPGLQLVRALGLYANWREGRTLVLGLAAGLLVSPVCLYLASLAFGFSRPVVFLTPILLVVGLAWLNRLWPAPAAPPAPLVQTRRQGFLLAGLLLLLALALLFPYLEGRTRAGLYPVEMADWFKHFGVSWAIRHTGVPPADIFFYGDPTRGKLAYYYFFHLTAASLDLLHGGVSSIYLSFVLLALLAALSCVLAVYLLARRVLPTVGGALAALLFATFIGGLDVIPAIPYYAGRFRQKFPDIPAAWSGIIAADHVDGWAPATYLRLNSLYVHYLWVPQHVTGLLAFVLGLYLFRETPDRRRLAIFAPLLLAALLGHSAWVALVAFTCLGLYALYDLFRRWQSGRRGDMLRALAAYTGVALVFLLLSLPLLAEMLGPDAPKSGVVFEIPLTGSWPVLTPFKNHLGPTTLARLLDLPLHYLVELGAALVCGLAGLWLFRRRNEAEPLLPFFILALLVGFVTISFFASGRSWTELGFTLNNDLAMRAILPAQAVLALFAGYFVARLPGLPLKRWLKAGLAAGVGLMMVLGLLTVLWELWAMGAAKYFKPPRIDPATYQAFQAMPTVTEPLSVIKHRTHDNASAYQLMYGDRSPGFFTVEAAVFHPDLRQVIYQFGLSRFAFLNRLPVWSYQMFREMYADYVYVGPLDRGAELSPEKFENPTYYDKVYDADDITIYRVRDLPLDQPLARFGPAGIHFMGYTIDNAPVYPLGFQTTSPRALVTAWRLEQPVDQDYTVYIHFVGPDGQVAGQADHQLWSWANQGEGPTSGWSANVTYLDIIPLPAEVLAGREPLRIGIGLWLPDTGQYLQVESKELALDAGQRLFIGAIQPPP